MTNNVSNEQDTQSNEDESGDEHSTDTVDTDSGSVGDDGANVGDGTDQDSRSDDDGSGDESGDKGKVSREAARWRTKYRDAEQTIGALQSQILSGAVESEGVRAAAFMSWLSNSGGSVADYVGKDGTVDSEKLSESIGLVRSAFGLSKIPAPDRALGRTDQDGKGSGDAGADWARAFSPKGEL